MLTKEKKKTYLRRILKSQLDYLSRKAIRKQILEQSKKTSICPNCGEQNGTVKKAGLLKIVHEKFKGKKNTDVTLQETLAEFSNVTEENKELESILQSGLVKILNPLEVNKSSFVIFNIQFILHIVMLFNLVCFRCKVYLREFRKTIYIFC